MALLSGPLGQKGTYHTFQEGCGQRALALEMEHCCHQVHSKLQMGNPLTMLTLLQTTAACVVVESIDLHHIPV